MAPVKLTKLTDSIHPKVMMCSRYASFHQSLLSWDKFPVRYLARLQEEDHRTVFGRTLSRIASECDVDFSAQKILSKTVVKKRMRYFPLPDGEAWRTSLLTDLLEARKDRSSLPGFSLAEVEELLQFVCTS